jgi:hypothetical protein
MAGIKTDELPDDRLNSSSGSKISWQRTYKTTSKKIPGFDRVSFNFHLATPRANIHAWYLSAISSLR